jgi:hypothetical protein
MPDEDQATDLRYRVKSESEAHERVVPESLLTSGVVAQREYALARSRILNRIIDRIPKEKDQVTD